MMDLTQVPFKPSPNFKRGRGGQKVHYICLHSMAGSFPGSSAWFMNPVSKVSAHYLVSQKGEVLQMVKDEDTAWHVYGLNQVAVGIEMEDLNKASQGPQWVTEKLYDAVVDLTVALCKKHSLTEKDVIQHKDEICREACRRAGKPQFVHKDPENWNQDKFKADVKARLNG